VTSPQQVLNILLAISLATSILIFLIPSNTILLLRLASLSTHILTLSYQFDLLPSNPFFKFHMIVSFSAQLIHILFNLACEQKIEQFHYNITDFYEEFRFGRSFTLPFYHPYRVIVNICFFGDMILVPLFYLKIYTFRKKLNEKNVGLSKAAVMLRKRRNLVTMKFNLFTWIWETSSMLIVAVNIDMKILYALSISCGPPLLYFMGIEENRRVTQEYFKANISIFRRNPKNQVNSINADLLRPDFGE
jgi:hypothetical protein